jgi:hypothetical protein
LSICREGEAQRHEGTGSNQGFTHGLHSGFCAISPLRPLQRLASNHTTSLRRGAAFGPPARHNCTL